MGLKDSDCFHKSLHAVLLKHEVIPLGWRSGGHLGEIRHPIVKLNVLFLFATCLCLRHLLLVRLVEVLTLVGEEFQKLLGAAKTMVLIPGHEDGAKDLITEQIALIVRVDVSVRLLPAHLHKGAKGGSHLL